ncbi:MAG: hypothetical protein F6K42_04040 [Leptolyngbya sp. SIO1D8]|nr:hypothetical protein [Leptolyngbya sp. SIO1D8]
MAMLELPKRPTAFQQALTDQVEHVRSIALGLWDISPISKRWKRNTIHCFADTSWLVQFIAAVALGNLKSPQATGVY